MKTLLDRMQISISSSDSKTLVVDAWVIPVFKDEKLSPELQKIDVSLGNAISRWVNEDYIQNDKEKNTWTNIPNKAFKTSNFLLINAGKKKDFTKNNARDIFGTAARICANRGFFRVGLFHFGAKEIPFDVALEGFLLGAYKFSSYKSEKNAQAHILRVNVSCSSAALATSLKQDFVSVQKIIRATYLVRDLVNEPANVIYPESFAQIAQKVAQEQKISIKVLKGADLKKEDMNLLTTVAQGSANPPCFIHMEYKPKKKSKSTVALVGKGVTFDTGGYSLKPATAMLGMKMDMAGAASVLGAIWAAAMLEIPVHIHAFMPMVENMISDRAVRPSDVIRARNGKSVEIDNTDAEGRLILADALNYAEDFNPDYLIDVATLTGACVVALGDEIAAIFSTDDGLQKAIVAASENVGEKMWHMPLEKNYFAQMKSEIADFKNVGGREGGSITAALFLKEFVSKTKWAHLDIAGPSEAQKDWPTCPKGGTGYPLRTFVNFLENLNR